MLMLLFNLRSQYWQQRKTESAIKAVINTSCCGNTWGGGEEKNPAVSPISNTGSKTTREKISSYLHSTVPQSKYFMLTELFDYETSITRVFHKQMSCKEAKQSELYEKAHLVNRSQHISDKSS